MKLNLSSRLLAGALVLAASGSVFANTNITDGTAGNGSLFLNVVDLTAGTDYVLDLSASSAAIFSKRSTVPAPQTSAWAATATGPRSRPPRVRMKFSTTWFPSTR